MLQVGAREIEGGGGGGGGGEEEDDDDDDDDTVFCRIARYYVTIKKA
jgi:hypothetical protein